MSKNLDKLKQFFRNSRGIDRIQVLTTEVERELRKDNAIEKRLKVIQEIGEISMSVKLEEFAVEKLFELTNDLLDQKSAEIRENVFIFYTKLIQGQYRELGMMRCRFFLLIADHHEQDDLKLRLDLLRTITDNGKDIQNFEVEIVKFMYKWMDQIIDSSANHQLTASFLALLVNLIKYNTSSFESHIINGIVQRVCNDICYKFLDNRDTFLQCLFIIETVICYCVFPDVILKPCIIVLCLAVNFEMYVDSSYKIMRNLLGTQFGYSTMLKMCNMLKEGKQSLDPYVLRGAIFHTNMNLWGGNNTILQNGFKYTLAVLSSYKEVLDCGSIIVTYEVILSLQTLIAKCGTELSELAWDIVLEILDCILKNIEHEKLTGENSDIMVRVHAIFDSLENLHQDYKCNVNADKVFTLMERISNKRSEASLIKLVKHKATKINTMTPGWLKQLQCFMERFYRNEKNQTIRFVAIEHMKEVIALNRACYEEEILEKVVIVIFSDIAQEPDVKIRVAICRLLLEICSHCDTKRCLELLDILEKVMNRPFDIFALDSTAYKFEYEFEDSIAVVNGLIDLFLDKLHQLPTNHAIKIYQILIAHLEAHYQNTRVFEHATKIRYSIINWMLRVRANAAFFIGYPSPRLISENIKYSHYLAIEGEVLHNPQTPSIQEGDKNEEKADNHFLLSHSHVTTLSIKRGCKIIVKCLELERDWPTVQLVLRELPKILQNKTLIQGNDVDILAKSLSDLFRISYDKELLLSRFSSASEQKDFRALVIPAIASLISYNSFLSNQTKKKIVEILKSEVRMDGNLSVCVQAFTILLMERCDIFERQLADIVLAVSKISDTMHVAIPILEFMSTITHLPYSLTNWNQKQFSYVFATCLPYTSPARYDHYVVSLAHHIIASWFLKSRLQWRKGYADYIIEGIAKNIDKSMQDLKQMQKKTQEEVPKNLQLINEDSSLRKRSSSLTEQSNRRKVDINNQQIMKLKAQRGTLQTLSNKDFDIHGFHIELIETCIDFMSRHTYSLSLALPHRLPSANYLLRGGGQSKTWIVGHSVITITTNACMENHEWANCSCYCSDWTEITIRRPTGMLSWMMKFQNQVGTFANDFSFHDLKGLFSDYELDPENPNGILVRRKNGGGEEEAVKDAQIISTSDETEKLLPLQSSDSAVYSFSTQPIDIPVAKSEPEHGVVESDDVSYDDDDDDSDDPKRNPVRRVNSSPEMRTNWKHSITNKNNPNSRDSKSGSSSTVADDIESSSVLESCGSEVQQKKKSNYSKETKVSCEAIPEEIGAVTQKEDLSTMIAHRPVQLLSSISAQEPSNASTIPKKQHSADDTIQLRRGESIVTSLQNRNQEWTTSAGNMPLSPRYSKIAVSRQVSHQLPLESDDSGYRARSKTISVIGRKQEVYENQSKTSDFSVSSSSIEQSQPLVATSGIQPSFVFVQLFNTGKFDSVDRPLPVSEKHLGTLNLLDFIPPYEIHKIGVIYVKAGQSNETEIFRNVNGSLRYTQFLHNLGTLIPIKDAKEKNLFVNMEPKREGNFTYVWHDDIIQMTFHVATLMPSLESDPNCNEKKKYIGNDFVTIVYNESGEEYNINTIKGQFNYACIIVQPLEMGSNLISIRAKGDIEDYFKHHDCGHKIISDRGAPLLARQLALHANMASLVSTSLKNPKTSPYANNWLERLRKIKMLKTRIAKDSDQYLPTPNTLSTSTYLKDVFTKYT